ncbi:MAG: cell division protein ZapA [Deltaproteobacteria bacterium]|nr:MAG: cell division protein ZapA [Deltaproteobacteria bacterium]
MGNVERLVEFELLGHQYQFYTDVSDEDVNAILAVVRELMESGDSTGAGTVATGKKAVLACLILASRYIALQREYADYKNTSRERILRLGNEIEKKIRSDSTN